MNICFITAGGIGTRCGSDIPKQYIEINARPIIVYTLSTFQKHKDIDLICISVQEKYIEYIKSIVRTYNLTKVKHIFIAGNSAQETRLLGLNELVKLGYEKDNVLIHDAVRPLISYTLISDIIKSYIINGPTVLYIPMKDTIVNIDNNQRLNVPNSILYRTQTPQIFNVKYIQNLYNKAFEMNILNDTYAPVDLVLYFNEKIHFMYGDEINFKITTSDDVDLFNKIISK